MHPTAHKNAEQFFQTYMQDLREINHDYEVVEIGSQNVNGSIRDIWPSNIPYTGVDFVDGNGVDLVLTDPYKIPLESESCDVVLSSSVFEHSEMFWLLYLEIMRLLKPHGLFYLNVPSNGDFHRWPVDCWRFYPDSGKALETWARKNGLKVSMLESYTSMQSTGDQWNDFVAVFVKDESFEKTYTKRILHTKQDVMNGRVGGNEGFIKQSTMNEDAKKLNVIRQVTENKIRVA